MKARQTHMFPDGADLPLISGTAPRVAPPFEMKARVPLPDPPTLFDLDPVATEDQKRFKCPYCGYECDLSELGGEFDCPWCGDN